MSEICKNCAQVIEVNFCSYCGQKKARRIDPIYLKEELQYTLLHTNKGFFYTVKQLVKNPGRTVREYLEGNRVGHYKPVLLMFVLSGVSVFLSTSLFDLTKIFAQYYAMHEPASEIERKITEAMVTGMSSIMKYYSLIMLLSIPIMSVFTWLVFKNWGYNYCENFVINTYYQSLVLLCAIVFVTPVQYLLRNDPESFYIYPTIISYIAMIAVFLWLYIGLYRSHGLVKIFRKMLLLLAVSVIAIMGLSILIGLVVGIMLSR